MQKNKQILGFFIPFFLAFILAPSLTVFSAELSVEKVLSSIKKGQDFIIKEQLRDGSWVELHNRRYGFNSLILLALLNSGMDINDTPVKKALNYLRNEVPESKPEGTYSISLMISALSAAKDGKRDLPRIRVLTKRLLSYQIIQGPNEGSWGYNTKNNSPDNSNSQFAVLGLRDATLAGVKIDRKVWERTRNYWRRCNRGGGWTYKPGGGKGSGSMTVAGISSLIICNSMLRKTNDFDKDGQPLCCDQDEEDKALKNGLRWMDSHFSVRSNPLSGQLWHFYFLYGLERSGRLSGNRFYGKHDWYREGAHFLISRQDVGFGGWYGEYGGGKRKQGLYGTSLALLFLSKGLAPVLFSKLKYGPDPDKFLNKNNIKTHWKKHSYDIPNLTEFIKTRPGWPKLMTWQIIDLKKLSEFGSVEELTQSPIIYLSGDDVLQLSDLEILMLKKYIENGGFIFSVANCQSAVYDDSFKEFITKMFPNKDATLQKLSDSHAVFRSEYLLDPETVELHGVNFGCRTAIIYSPDDIACLWNKWMLKDPRNRSVRMKSMITRAIRIGVNVAAYATGREPPSPLAYKTSEKETGVEDNIERGLLQVAKLRHTGGWDTAPHAVRNLLKGLNALSGLSASTQENDLTATDRNLFKYPIVYMHGRRQFTMNDQEVKHLRNYLDNGGVLLADACCGDTKFDTGFRKLIKKIYPQKNLNRIPATHEIFNNTVGYDLKQVQRRAPATGNGNKGGGISTITGEPFLEGIKTDDRYSIIYSKYDISCALERQASTACSGYIEKDALKISINMILYAMLQDVKYKNILVD